MTIVAYDRVQGGVKFYGGAASLWRYKGQEVMLSGPFETGKTIAALSKLHALLVKYPKSRAFMTRKTYKSLVPTAVVTYENKVLPVHPDSSDSPIQKYGGSKPEFYQYPNGSHLLVVGLDNADKLLSGEFDFGYINQAEENPLSTWETLVTRVTGRAGNAPYPQLMGDCNPSVPTHWILHRASLERFEQLHRHNPVLYDPQTGELTAQGIRTMSVLESLTGIRKKRGLLNQWVAAEGVVYDEFDESVHVIPRDRLPEFKSRYMAIDFGYINPFVAQWWGEDYDGRLYLYREIYHTKRTVKVHSDDIKRLECGMNRADWNALSEESKNRVWHERGEKIQLRIADHDAEDRATLVENEIYTAPAKKEISVGIEKVQERLRTQGDGRPRLFVVDDACAEYDPTLYREYPGDLHPCCTRHEFPVYAYPESVDGKRNKEQPIDLNNHGLDATRYMVMETSRESTEWLVL